MRGIERFMSRTRNVNELAVLRARKIPYLYERTAN